MSSNNERVNQKVKEIMERVDNECGIKKIDISYYENNPIIKAEKAKKEKQKRKEFKQIEREMRRSAIKPAFLVLLAGILEKFLHIIVTLYTMAMVVNLLFIWEIYKAVSAGGWQAVFHSKYTLFVLAYFALLFILNKIYFALYIYANE